MPTARHWIGPALYMPMIIALSSIPGSAGPATDPGPIGWVPPVISNALHLPLYAGLAFLWARALALGGAMEVRRAAWLALAIAAAFGCLDELYQGLIPGRTPGLGDWLADTVGAAAGSAVFLRWRAGQKPPS